MSNYFMLQAQTPIMWEDRALLRATPIPEGEISWTIGRAFKNQPDLPIEIEMNETHSDDLIQLHKADALIMPKTMLEALNEVGVTNLDAYETVIRHPETGFVTEEYVACNLVGLVSAIDIENSNVVDGSSDHLLDTGFDGLTIDEEKAQGFLMFRLAENTGAVVVHKKVREQLEAKGFDHLVFVKPEDWVG